MALDGHDYKRNRASIDRMMVCGKIFTDFYREYDLATFQSHFIFEYRSGYEWKIANVNWSNWRYFYYINVHDINKNFKFNSNFYIQNYFYNGKKTKI